MDGRIPKEGHYTTITLSPQKGHELEMQEYTRQFMRNLEKDTDQKLHWYAAVHTNTDHPHAHIVVRGRNAAVRKDRGREPIRYGRYGKQTYFQHEYVKQGMRRVAQNVATRELGYRTNREIRRQEQQELTANRITRLDRALAERNERLQLTSHKPLDIDKKLAEKQELSQLTVARPLTIDRNINASANAASDGRFTPKDKNETKRLEALVGLQLAHKHSDNTYSMTPNWRRSLRDLQRKSPDENAGHLVPETKEEKKRLNALVHMGFARTHGARGYSLNDDWQLALKSGGKKTEAPELKPANSDQAKRLAHLKELGLAQETTRYTYKLKPNWQRKLRELGHKNDIIKQIHKDAPQSIDAGAEIANNRIRIQGRVVRKDYTNEDLKKPYIIIRNNTDGKYYHYASKTADAAEEGQFVRLDKGALQDENGDQIHRDTPYLIAQRNEPPSDPGQTAYPVSTDEYETIKANAFEAAQKVHEETANRELTQSERWVVRGTIAFAKYDEKLGKSVLVLRARDRADYYYTETIGPKHANYEIGQEALYVGKDVKVGEEARSYWTDSDVCLHAMERIRAERENTDRPVPEESEAQMLGSTMDVSGRIVHRSDHPRTGNAYVMIESLHAETGIPAYFYHEDDSYAEYSVGDYVRVAPNSPPERIPVEEFRRINEATRNAPRTQQRAPSSYRQRSEDWLEHARAVSEKPHAQGSIHHGRSVPVKGRVVTIGYDGALEKHAVVIQNKEGLHLKYSPREPTVREGMLAVFSGNQVIVGDRADPHMRKNDYLHAIPAAAALKANDQVNTLTPENSPVTGMVVHVSRWQDEQSPFALIKIGEQSYVLHESADYAHAHPGDEVRASAADTDRPVAITRPASQEVSEAIENAAQKYWLKEAQRAAELPAETLSYIHAESHDVVKGTVVLSEIDAPTSKAYTVLRNQNGLFLKTQQPGSPLPKPGEPVAFAAAAIARGADVEKLTTKDERISAAISAANGNKNAPIHRLDKPDMEAAGKVIARADHPTKSDTGYAVIEATYAGGKKAYFYHQHSRYSSASSNPIKEGAHVYVNTTTHRKPMKIKAEYIQPLNEGRTPQNPQSRDHVAKRKAGGTHSRESGEDYGRGRSRRIT